MFRFFDQILARYSGAFAAYLLVGVAVYFAVSRGWVLGWVGGVILAISFFALVFHILISIARRSMKG